MVTSELEDEEQEESRVHAKSLQSCQILCDPMDCRPPGSSVCGDSPGRNSGVGCLFLLQRLFPTQGSNLCLLCLLLWQADSSPLSCLEILAVSVP